MASVNKVILVGNLGRDPETRYMPNGEAVTNIALATTESWKDKNSGEKKEQTEWHRVTFYRGLAEVAGQYLKKGSSIYIEGRLQTRKWTDKDGVERYTTEIIADEMKMLGAKPTESANQPRQQTQQQGASAKQYDDARNGSGNQQSNRGSSSSRNFNDMDDDIPF